MISISAAVADTSGSVVIKNMGNSNTSGKAARISRTKTLDGGVYIDHSGYVEGDMTFTINTQVKKSIYDILDRLFRLYTRVLISVDSGLYYGAISDIDIEDGFLKMTVYIEFKES